jgi:TetR/AcrR family transcriptional regulator
MGMPQPSRPATPRSERTRVAILGAAEGIFAEKGFDGTRLEDVAQAVGIRRASIVYYFKDKRELYDAVLAAVFGGFLEKLREALSGPGPPAQLIESAVCAWVDYVGRRPSLARLLLREVADATPSRQPAILGHIRPFFDLVERFLAEHAGDDLPRLIPIDPAHLAGTIAGATVFLVAAMPTLVPSMEFDLLTPRHLERHRSEVLRITRRLLGTSGPRPAPPRRPPPEG